VKGGKALQRARRAYTAKENYNREGRAMSVSRRRFLVAAGASLAAPAIAKPALAQVTLKLHHFLPPVSNGHAKMLAPWAKMVEQDSGGKIKIDVFPSMQLGGTPPQLYDQARDGVVDMVLTLPGYTPGRLRDASHRRRCSSCRSLRLGGVSSMHVHRRSTPMPTLPRRRATSSC
jgi:hypothetical protein